MHLMARPLVPWVGNKEKLLPFIQQMIPPDTTQLTEAFGGSGALTLGIPPKAGRLDIYNDLNNNLFNAFCCVKERMNALIRELRFFPVYGRVPFDLYRNFMAHEADFHRNIQEEREILDDPDNPCGFSLEQIQEIHRILSERDGLFDVQRAAAFLISAYGCYNGNIKSFGIQTVNVESILQRAQEASARLQSIVLENQDGLGFITRCGKGQTVYADPPYFKTEKLYDVVFTPEQHLDLRERARNCKGNLILSYGNCPQAWELYKENFFLFSLVRNNPMSQTSGATYEELIITNYDPRPYMNTQLNLFAPTPKTKWELVLISTPKTH